MKNLKKPAIWHVHVPGYITKKNVDYQGIGKKLDKIIRSNLKEKNIVMRCLGSQDHPQRTTQELVEIIKQTGTDRYDPKRKIIFHKFYAKHNPDLFASPVKVSENTPSMAEVLKKFYTKTTGDRKIGVRADIVVFYDPKKLEMVKHVYKGQEESDLFKFKNPKNKQKAVLGIIEIDS